MIWHLKSGFRMFRIIKKKIFMLIRIWSFRQLRNRRFSTKKNAGNTDKHLGRINRKLVQATSLPMSASNHYENEPEKQNRNPRMMNSNNKFQMYSTLTSCPCFIQHKLKVWTKTSPCKINGLLTSFFKQCFYCFYFIMHNLHEFIHIRNYVYVIQLPTYNLIVQNTGKFVTLFQRIHYYTFHISINS